LEDSETENIPNKHAVDGILQRIRTWERKKDTRKGDREKNLQKISKTTSAKDPSGSSKGKFPPRGI